MQPPNYAQPIPVGAMPQPQQLPGHRPWQQSAQGQTVAQQPQAPRPTIRAQAADEPMVPEIPPARAAVASAQPLVIPPPEQLGLVTASTPGPSGDWTRRLERLGATCFHMEMLKTGAFQATCMLPTSQPAIQHRIETQAGTQSEAVRLALDQAEQWVGRK